MGLLDRKTRRVLLNRVVSSSLLVSIRFKPPAPVVFSADEELMAFTGEVKGRLHIGIYTMRDFRRQAVLVGERPVFSADGRYLVVNERWVHTVRRAAGGLALPRVRSLLRKRGK